MDKVKELWQRFMKQASSDYRQFGDGTGEIEREGIDKLDFIRLFSWDKSKYFWHIGIHDVYDDTVIFHSRTKSELNSFAHELANNGIRVVYGRCRNPSLYDEGQEIGIINDTDLVDIFDLSVGVNRGRAIFYLYVVTKQSMMEWIK